MNLHTTVLIISALMFFSCNSMPKPKPIEYSAPANPQANSDVQSVLRYITALSNNTTDGVIAGQNCYHGDEITSEHYLDGYNSMIAALHSDTGKYPGLIGVDYEYARIFTSQQLSAANEILIDYWNEGGLVMITWTPHNPWVNDGSDLENNPGTWDGPGHVQDQTGVILKDLVDPSTQVYAAWRRRLDRIAGALAELRDAGVVVLWRPMQEMNGNWHWWGMKTHPDDPSEYTDIFIDMFTYFSYEKELDNLLWVYSPNIGSSMNASWNRPVDWAYPGDDYVDIVAGTSYSDTLEIDDYQRYLSFGKPLGMGEYSPEIGGSKAKDGSLDTMLYAERLLNNYPAIAFWVSWHSYPGEAWSIIANKNSRELMNHPGIITRDAITWKEENG